MTLSSATALLLLTSVAREIPAANTTLAHPRAVNNSFIIEIVADLNAEYKFKNFVFYATERLRLDNEKAIEFYGNFWATFNTTPITMIRASNGSFPMDGFLSTPSLILIFTTDLDDPIMEVAAKSLQGIRYLKTIFVLFPILDKYNFYEREETFNTFKDTLEAIMDWAWKKQFLRTLLLTIHNQVYLQEPYPIPEIINKTSDWTIKDFFINYERDFHGYVVDTPIRYDLPRVFFKTRNRESKTGNEYLSGTSGLLFAEFIKHINASITDSTLTSAVGDKSSVDINGILALISEKSLEISVHSCTAMTPQLPVSYSYPLAINDWCIMVPYRNNTADMYYIQNSLQLNTWLLIIFTTAYISMAIWLCTPLRPREFSAAFLQAICSLICIPPTAILRSPVQRIYFLNVSLFLFGFVISNMYSSKMASYLASSLPHQQIDTMDDVVAANLRIKVLDFEYDQLAIYASRHSTHFLQQVDVVSRSYLDSYRDVMNTSYGYSVQTDRWGFLNRQQSYLKKPLFRLSHICIGPYYHAFPMQKDSHLRKALQYFILYSRQSGLIEYWEKRAFSDAKILNYVFMFMLPDNVLPLSMTFFSPIWFVWWFGMVLAGFTLILEMKWLELKIFLNYVLNSLATMNMAVI